MHGQLETPVGTLTVEATENGIVGAGVCYQLRQVDGGGKAKVHVERALEALTEYFAGTRRTFEDLVLTPQGTLFQRRVWDALVTIPFGETTSYGAIAAALGSRNGARAVGLANGKNPIGIIIPCHRVIGSTGRLTGYAGGLAMKQWLLRHEARVSGDQMAFAFSA